MRVIRNENARWDFHSGGVKLSDKVGIAAFVLSFESVTSQFQFSKAEAVSTESLFAPYLVLLRAALQC